MPSLTRLYNLSQLHQLPHEMGHLFEKALEMPESQGSKLSIEHRAGSELGR
jgi:hypothetical protein